MENKVFFNLKSSCSGKTQIIFSEEIKNVFLVRLFQLESSVVRLAQTTNANGFGTMSRITIMFVAPLITEDLGAIEVY